MSLYDCVGNCKVRTQAPHQAAHSFSLKAMAKPKTRPTRREPKYAAVGRVLGFAMALRLKLSSLVRRFGCGLCSCPHSCIETRINGSAVTGVRAALVLRLHWLA